jgi:hypothetical protein
MQDQTVNAGDIRLQVTGLTALARDLRKAGADSADLRTLMRQVGALVVKAAYPLAPNKTGRLAATIRAGGGKTKAVVRAGGAKVPYAGVQHYGWPAHHIAPHPFLTTAVAQQQANVIDRIEDGIQAILDKNQL